MYRMSWVQRGADIDGEAMYDRSGKSVSISSDGTVVAIGAILNDGNGSNSGQVRVYAWNGTAWVQRGSDINGEASGNMSGFSVSLSSDGTIVAIGAPNNSVNTGHARVYAWNGTAWVQRGSDIDGEAGGDQFGHSVSLSSDGTIVAISSMNNTSNDNSFAGHVRVYVWNGTAWVQRGADIDGKAAADQSGQSVSLSSDGTVVAIGAPFNMNSEGYVSVYEWDGSAWVQRGLDILGEAGGDSSGWSVALSADGAVLAIGAVFNSANSGHVRVYAWNGTAWVKRGLDIDGEAQGDQSGYSVSLSSGGTVVAIGAQNNSNDTGHVRVYTWNGTAWVQTGMDIDGEASGDLFGQSVSLASNGTTIAIGASSNSGNGTESGHTRVYTLVSPPSGGGGGIPCIPKGQHILTPNGYARIETLKDGDLVQTASGTSVPVRVYSTTLEKTTKETAPIRIGSSLRLSPLHTFKVSARGWMFAGLAAVKGLYGAVQEPEGQSVTYYHIETPNYLQDDLVVEGTVVESFGKTFAKVNNVKLQDIYKRSNQGAWFERMSSYTRTAKHAQKN
jgi:hypothetical protein